MAWEHLTDPTYQKVQFYNLKRTHLQRTQTYHLLFGVMWVAVFGALALATYRFLSEARAETPDAAARVEERHAHELRLLHALEERARRERAASVLRFELGAAAGK